MVARACGNVQLAGVFEGRDDGGANGGPMGGPLPLGETAGTRAAQVAANARLKETGTLRRTIGARTHWLSLEPAVLSQATDSMERKRACGAPVRHRRPVPEEDRPR